MSQSFDQLVDLLGTLNTTKKSNIKRIEMYHKGETFSYVFSPSSVCNNCYSISKNFTATAVAIASNLGLIKLTDKVIDLLRDDIPEIVSMNLGKVTVQHLLDQTMGIDHGYLFEEDRYSIPTDNWVGYCLSQPLPNNPGTVFTYSNVTYYLLSCIIEKTTGLPLDMFLDYYLFRKIGVRGFAWERCPEGHVMGATGLYISTNALMKFGVLYMNHGITEKGEIILPETWIASLESFENYHNSFWRSCPEFYKCSGAHNQSVYIAPSKKLVIAINAYNDLPETNYDSYVESFILNQ